MSWNGTVRCSYCFKLGHNRATCPELKKHIEENPEGYEVRRERRKAARRAESAKNRRCSYCDGDARGGKINHNRRGCKLRKADMAEFARRNLEWRTKLIEAFKEVGLGPGALLEVPYHRNRWNAEDSPIIGRELYLVEEIMWQRMTHRLQGHEEDHSESRISYAKQQRDTVVARLVGLEGFPENFSEIDYWHSNNHKIGAQHRLDVVRLGITDLIGGQNEEGRISDGYAWQSPEKFKIKLVAPTSAAAVQASVPKDYLDLLVNSQAEYELNFDKEGFRRVDYKHEELERESI